MIRFFKSLQPAALFVIPVIVLLLWVQSFFNQNFLIEEPAMPLYKLAIHVLRIMPVFLQVLITMVLISLQAVYFSNMLNRHEIFSKTTYLPAFMYVLVMSLTASVLHFHPVILVNLFLLLALDRLFSLFKNDFPISPLFDSTFLVSIASLIYFPSAMMIILFLISLAILRPFQAREWMIALTGFCLPYFFLSVYFFWTDQFVTGWRTIIDVYHLPGSAFSFAVNIPLKVLFILLLFLLFISFWKIIKSLGKNTVRTRSNRQILLLFLVTGVASSFLLLTVPVYHVTLLAIPLAFLFGNYFLEVKKKLMIAESLLWLLIAVIAWNHF